MFDDLKQRVYAANIQLSAYNLAILTWGNVSEIDRAEGVVAIKPSGVPYDALSPDDIVLVNLDGDVVGDCALRPSSDTPTHLALYNAWPQIGGVTHTHATHATIFSQARVPISCFGTTHADHFYGDVPVTRELTEAEVSDNYEANTGKAIVACFAKRDPLATPGVLSAGHGPFTWGKDAMASVTAGLILEEIARMALGTLSLAPTLKSLPHYIMEKHYSRKHGPDAYYGQQSD